MNNEDNQKNKVDVRFTAMVAVVSGVLYFFLPSIMGKVIALFLLAVFGWKVAYEGATILSARLTEPHHRTYQVAAALIAPLIMSLFFVFSSDTLDASKFFFGGWSLYDLFFACILVFFGWVGGDQLDPKHPFRAYWIAATIVFVLNLMGHTGVTGADDYNGEGTRLAVDSKQAFAAAETGYYFFHYLYQVAIVYSGMFAHRIRENYWTWKRRRTDVPKVPDDAHEVEKLLRTLIDHSVNGIIRLRWQSDDESDSNDLRCVFANEAAGRLLTVGIDGLINCSGEQIFKIATSGMDSSIAENLRSQFLKATETGESIDVEVGHASGESAKWFRLISEPFGSDVAVTVVDITDGKTSDDLKNLELKKLRDRVRELEGKI